MEFIIFSYLQEEYLQKKHRKNFTRHKRIQKYKKTTTLFIFNDIKIEENYVEKIYISLSKNNNKNNNKSDPSPFSNRLG